MSQEPSAPGNAKLLLVGINSLASFILTALMLRHGVIASSDSWFYWVGSVNLIEHGKYITMLGEPITGWPPFFSLFLALFQEFLPQTGWVLALAMSVISAMVAGIWTLFVFSVFANGTISRRSLAFAGSMLFVVLFSALSCGEMMANPLLLFILGIIFTAIAASTDRPQQWASYKKPLTIALLLAAGMLTHNSTLIFAVSIAVMVFIIADASLPRRLMASAVIMVFSIGPWLIVRHLMGQEASHSISSARYTFSQYLFQVPREMGVFFIPAKSVIVQAIVGVIVLAAVVVLWARRPQSEVEKRHSIMLGLALVALAGHFILFNLVWIDSAIGGRFTWYFALTIVPIFFYLAAKRLEIVALLLLLTVGVSGWRVAKFVWHGKVPALTVIASEETPLIIYPFYFLTSRPDAPVPAGTIQVIPPVYHWQIIPPEMKKQVGKLATVKLIKIGAPGSSGSPKL